MSSRRGEGFRIGRGFGRIALVMLLATFAFAAHAADASSPDGLSVWRADSLHDRVDREVRDGHERPDLARRSLEKLLATLPASGHDRLVALQGLVAIEAESARPTEALAAVERMAGLVATDDTLGQAMVALSRAQANAVGGNGEQAAALAQSALIALRAVCRPTLSCDYRNLWRAERLLQRRSVELGALPLALDHENAALTLATGASDTYRQAVSLGALAVLSQQGGDAAAARTALQQAMRLADTSGDARLIARIHNDGASMASQAGDDAAMLRHREEALASARRAGARRLEVQMLANLSDAYVHVKRHADALQAAERALALAHELGETAAERVLINNAGLARIGLGQIEEGKRDMARAIELSRQRADASGEMQTLREYGVALAAAGDATAALALYHQERAIHARVVKENGAAVLRELQVRNDAEAKQRRIDLLSRASALKSEELANSALRQRIVWLVAALMSLSIVIAAALYQKVRLRNQRLNESHDMLRVQSERDALTGLANRRHVHAVLSSMAARGDADAAFEGALLLVDIDHFKRVNDGFGHGAGDAVLVDVARRLEQATRRGDLVARWGGEEFLILAPKASAEQLDQLAMRVLEVVSGTPIEAGDRRLSVTASIGYARFPLPPGDVSVPWEMAIKLVDRALYWAKSEGRHRAIGISSMDATHLDGVRAAEADFDAAYRSGHVVLKQSRGTPLPISPSAATPEATPGHVSA